MDKIDYDKELQHIRQILHDLGIVLDKMPEGTPFDRESKDIYDSLIVIDQELRKIVWCMDRAGEGPFSIENIGIWNGMLQDMHCMIKHCNLARKRISDMWNRTEIRKHHGGASDNRPEGQKGSVCDE